MTMRRLLLPVLPAVAVVALLAAPAGAQAAESCPNEALRIGPSATLPDCRAFEQVTPADKSATVTNLEKKSTYIVPAVNGERVALKSQVTFGPQPQENGSASVFSRTSSGWKITSVKPVGTGAADYVLQLLSPELTQVGVESYTEEPRSPDNTFGVGVPGGPFAPVAETPRGEGSGELEGGSSDLSHVVLQSDNHTLLSATPTGTDETATDLYEWVDGQLRLLNVEGEGAQAQAIGKCGATLGGEGTVGGDGGLYDQYISHNAVSADGSKIFFSVPDPEPGNPSEEGCSYSGQRGPDARRLYMRVSETAGGHEQSRTLEVAAPNTEVHLSPAEEKAMLEIPVFYQAATTAGSKVFFLSARTLTSDATAGEGHLYEYDTEVAEGQRVKLIYQGSDLNQEEELPGVWVFPSEDGSVVYFYTNTGDVTPVNNGEVLYRYEAGAGPAQELASVHFPKADEVPYTTPNGEFFTFDSRGVSVEGKPESRGAGKNELYRYDHADGSVMCVSCGPGPGPAPGKGEVLGFGSLAAIGEPALDQTPQRIPISDDGSEVFFQSTGDLLPQVVTKEGSAEFEVGNEGVLNVYEWEADGSGSCTKSPGCTYLISPGNNQEDHGSYLIGASADGSNVFFLTNAQLVAQDTDTSGDIYDARVDGGFPGPAESAACLGDTCLSVPPALVDPTPASLSFSGPENPVPLLSTVKAKAKTRVKQCAKGRVRKKGRCVVRPKAKQTARRAAKHNRGGSK